MKIDENEDGNLHETIAYYNHYTTAFKKLDALLSFIAYRRFFKKLVKKHFKHFGRPDLVHVHVAFRAGIIALWIAKKFGIPYLVTEHWSGYNPEDKMGLKFQSVTRQRYVKSILQNATMVVPVSTALGSDLSRFCPVKKMTIIHNVVNESLFHPASLNKPPGTFRFLHVSTMGPEKQPELLFRAFDAFRKDNKAELVCLGTVPPGLEAWIQKHISHHESILFRGNVSYETVGEEMRQANCLLITSVYETFSCVAAEGMLSGLPVIATPVGVLPELINHENGLLVQNEQELITAMTHVYHHINEYFPGRIAREQQGRFSYQNIGAKLVELYNNC